MTISISYFLLFSIFPTILVCFVTVTASPRPSHTLSQFPTRSALSGGLPFSSLIQRLPFWRSFPSFCFSHLLLSCFLLCFAGVYLPVFFSGWRQSSPQRESLQVPLFRHGRLAFLPGAWGLPSSSPRVVPSLLLCWSSSFCVMSSHLRFHLSRLWVAGTSCPHFCASAWLWPCSFNFPSSSLSYSWQAFSAAFQGPGPSYCPVAVLPSAK